MERRTRAIVHDGRITVERDLLTLDELAALTGWGKTRLHEDARKGNLPFPTLHLGRRIYFSRRAYEQWRDSGNPD